MAQDYEPNASGLVTIQSAQNSGASVVNDASGGFDLGQKIQTAQVQQQMLQQKMIENHAAMTNHLAQRMASLAGMPDDAKKGPMWDMQTSALKQDLNSFGAPITPDSLDNMLTDPAYSSRLSAALNATAQAGLDPVAQAKVVQDNAAALGRPDMIQDFPENVQKSLQTQAMINQKMAGQDIRKQTLVNNFVNNTNGIQKDFDKNIEQSQNIQSILKPGVPYQTGMPQVAAMDALTKLLTGTVVRQFTYDNLKGTINAPDRYMQAIDKQLNSGQPLNEKQVQDVRLIAKTVQGGSDKLRLQMLAAKHNEAKGMINNAGYAGYEDQIRGAFDPDDWNNLEDQAKKNTFNPQTQRYEKQNSDGSTSQTPVKTTKVTDSAPKIQNYKVGQNAGRDNFLKTTIAGGHSLNDVNQVLSKYKMRISPEDYKSLGGK